MLTVILAACLFVVGIGLFGGALFGRLRQRRLILFSAAVALWVVAAALFISWQSAQTAAPAEETPVVAEVQPTPAPTATVAPPTPTPTPTPSLGRIVFPSERSGALKLWVMDLNDPHNPRQLTSGPGSDVEPLWSPDGAQVLFSSSRPNTNNVNELYVIDADGRNERRLLDWPTSYEWGATWAPDGQRIAFATTRDYYYEIYVMNVDGSGEPVNLTQSARLDSFASWSPDGRWLAFMSDRSGFWDIWKIDVEACLQARQEGAVEDERCEAIQLTDNPDDDMHPRWSPDGSQIAFASRREANRDIYVMDADGGNLTRITHHPAQDSAPFWALDGRAIIYSSEREFDWDLYLIDLETGEERRLTDSQGEDRFGDWTP